MTSPKSRRPSEARVSLFVDEYGILCVRVPLANSSLVAILWKEDYDRIKRAGVSASWDYNSNGNGSNYVRSRRPGIGRVTIARLVMGEDSEGRWVRYLNGDRCDLRRNNLALSLVPEERRAHGRESSLIRKDLY